jgi:hypothetical protein
LNSTRKGAILFAAAGLLSASIYVWYSVWVDDLYKTMPQNPVYSADPSASRGSFSDSAWYRSNVALTKYADRKWPILCLGFPIALTIALLLAKSIGWLQHVKGSQALVGLPLYLVPGLILFVSAISWYVLFIPALAAAGWVLAMTVDKIKSKRSKAFRKFLISGGVCLALWVVVLVVNQKDFGGTAWYVLLTALETIWAGIFGMELAADFSV